MRITEDNVVVDFFEKQIQLFVEAIRPQEDIRDKLDIGYKFKNGEFEIFEIRPARDNKDKILHFPFAKGKFVKSRGVWKLYWKRASGNWDSYTPHKEVKELQTALKIIKEDKHHCFFG